MAILRTVVHYPLRPARELATLQASGRPVMFAVLLAVLICVLAAARAWVYQDARTGALRLGSSLGGFVLLAAVATVAGRLAGGSGRPGVVAAAIVGSGIPFVFVDALWLAAVRAPPALHSLLTIVERLSWAWALALLVIGLSQAHAFSRLRAAGTVLAMVGTVAALTWLASSLAGAG